jgi:hypothetical protein
MKRCFLIFACFGLICCNNAEKHDKVSVVVDTTYLDGKTHEALSSETEEINSKRYEDREEQDSIRLLDALSNALRYAERFRNKVVFQHEFVSPSDDSSYYVTVQLSFGSLFENERKHLIVRRIVPGEAHLNIYLLHNSEFKPLLERVQAGLTYVDDTLKDVNGDRYKDFLVHWYPSSGCCLADVYNVYLYQSRTGGFSSDYEFINPSFFPDEKVIRGLGYGHPGEAHLYKYMWNGLSIDTVEFIYPYHAQEGQFIKTKKLTLKPDKTEGAVFYQLPIEYSKIDSIASRWFLDKL